MAWLMVATVGCGGPGPGEPAPASSALPGLVGRSCQYVSTPQETPAFRDLVSVGTGGSVALWGSDMGPADSVEVSIRYGRDGRLEWVESIRSTVDSARTAGLEALVLDALHEDWRGDWGVRVLVVGGDVVATEPSVICDPERVGGSAIYSSLSGRADDALRDFFRRQGSRYPVRVTLDAEGRVLDARLVRSTYSRWVDQYIIDYVRNSNFAPKLHDGIGVSATFELHLRFRRN